MSVVWLHGFKTQLLKHLSVSDNVIYVSKKALAYLNKRLKDGDIVYFSLKNNYYEKEHEVVKYTHNSLNSICDGLYIDRDISGIGKLNMPSITTIIESDFNPGLHANL